MRLQADNTHTDAGVQCAATLYAPVCATDTLTRLTKRLVLNRSVAVVRNDPDCPSHEPAKHVDTSTMECWKPMFTKDTYSRKAGATPVPKVPAPCTSSTSCGTTASMEAAVSPGRGKYVSSLLVGS